jgi:hypothetical protein
LLGLGQVEDFSPRPEVLLLSGTAANETDESPTTEQKNKLEAHPFSGPAAERFTASARTNIESYSSAHPGRLAGVGTETRFSN